MRIAQLAPLYESVPPRTYGGTERVVSYLTEALVDLGHEVTLFASADSLTRAELVPCAARALRLGGQPIDATSIHLLEAETLLRLAPEFDLVHNHLDHLWYPFARRCELPVLTTLHGRLDLEWLEWVYREYQEQRVISISQAQREPLPWLRWAGTVHHGLPRHLYRFDPHGGDALVFVGRIAPEKRVDRAVEIAVRSERPLRIAAKVDPADADYYRERIRPLLDHPLVEYVGELGDAEKGDLLGSAAALLFPIDWPEPFGLTMIEALACGTPVIAWPHGSVREVLEPGRTGFLCDDVGSAVRAVRQLDKLDRAECRRAFEARFTADRMAREYVALYERLLAGRAAAHSRVPVEAAPETVSVSTAP
jgi:glycosyltransferase involved in cell wall biosynthesis